jgi:hypothetical protein
VIALLREWREGDHDACDRLVRSSTRNCDGSRVDSSGVSRPDLRCSPPTWSTKPDSATVPEEVGSRDRTAKGLTELQQLLASDGQAWSAHQRRHESAAKRREAAAVAARALTFPT